jgi:preprotein translocase subunit SecG
MQTVIIVIHLMVVVAMIGLVLLQKSEGGGLGMGGGGGGGFLSSRGTSNVLTRSTAILAGVFFATSLTLSILAGLQRRPTSILPSSGTPASQPAQPGSTNQPLGTGSGGILNQLQPPTTPAAPSTPAQPAPPTSK